MDHYWKKINAILMGLAKEDPNRLLREIYFSGMSGEELEEMQWLVDIARRAPGYIDKQDLLRILKVL